MQDFLEQLKTPDVYDGRDGGFEIYLTEGDGRLCGEQRTLFDLFPANRQERSLFSYCLPFSEEFRLLTFGKVPAVAVCIGYASTRLLPVVIPHDKAAEELAGLTDGAFLHPRLIRYYPPAEPLPASADISHADELLSVLDRAFLFTERGDTQPHVVSHVLTVRATAMARLFGCRVRVMAGGFGFSRLPLPDYGWCAGVLAAVFCVARRAGADKTVTLLFDKPESDLPLCHVLLETTDCGDLPAELTRWNGPEVRGVFYDCHRMPTHPHILHVTFSLSVCERSVQGVRVSSAYLPDQLYR